MAEYLKGWKLAGKIQIKRLLSPNFHHDNKQAISRNKDTFNDNLNNMIQRNENQTIHPTSAIRIKYCQYFYSSEFFHSFVTEARQRLLLHTFFVT